MYEDILAEFMMTAEHLSNEYDINDGEGPPRPFILKASTSLDPLAVNLLTRYRTRKMARGRLYDSRSQRNMLRLRLHQISE